ncbi:MAG: D-alanyl-D-alanine carboxypeptidase/D-alanyl-D-alanine-endopeptidase [Rhizobacter sp.]|nr:D-alanyl-D-alanine carboxypeptidase/D-alanyl-D-alanine-endopeptidase [Ferruginibacter sp.]
MKFFPLLLLFILPILLQAQMIEDKLKAAVAAMEKDDQFAHASIGFYVVNSNTGAVLFDKNSQLGLVPASTLKVVTSASAYEMLGKDFMYKSAIGYNGMIENGILNGSLIFTGSGDPTLGSWRWQQTNENAFKEKFLASLKINKIDSVTGDVLVNETIFESQATPNGWTWEDIGNYYGAAAWGANWYENQYDAFFRPGKNVGDPVEFLSTEPKIAGVTFINELKTGKAGSGDNSIIYLPENGVVATIRGTLPAGAARFKVSGSIPNAPHQMTMVIMNVLKKAGINISGRSLTGIGEKLNGKKIPSAGTHLADFYSPTFDSINYWFLRESVNLFGEALVKTIALTKKGIGTTSDGLDLIKEYWKSKGIDNGEMKIKDGSGLSPANRITPHALVTVMQYAGKQEWFSSFYHSLPLQNNIKMKSGYIGGVRSYTGYIKSKNGEEYTFAFIINNFDGSPGAVREKMWKLLDILK